MEPLPPSLKAESVVFCLLRFWLPERTNSWILFKKNIFAFYIENEWLLIEMLTINGEDKRAKNANEMVNEIVDKAKNLKGNC